MEDGYGNLEKEREKEKEQEREDYEIHKICQAL